jgi:hypothetical protein
MRRIGRLFGTERGNGGKENDLPIEEHDPPYSHSCPTAIRSPALPRKIQPGGSSCNRIDLKNTWNFSKTSHNLI